MNILIVGGSSGIGASICKLAFEQGNTITLFGRTKPTHSNYHNFFEFDVTSEDAFPPEIQEIGHLIYCPGSIRLKPFHRLTKDDFYHDWNLNFYGAVKVLQHAFPFLKVAKEPSVLLFSSVAAQTGMSFHASIAAAKAAIEGLTLSLAAEWAPTIRVNAIAPSLHQTNLASSLLSSPEKELAAAKRHPLNRIGHPDDLAALALFLISPAASFVSGQILKVDGGLSNLR
jgi:NAD(P)-dependent dehydrogenase (short-subunit alcohol dehydrogenase family)